MSAQLPVPQRLGAKIFIDEASRLSAETLLPVFHEWISQQAVDEVLIDVVDYSHVRRGPALMLVALEADYVLDEGDGETGIRYIRKRALPASFEAAVTQAVLQAARACLLLDVASFDANRIEITLLDKLHFSTASAALENALSAIAATVHAGQGTVTAIPDDPRRPLRFVIRHTGDTSLEELVARLETSLVPGTGLDFG